MDAPLFIKPPATTAWLKLGGYWRQERGQTCRTLRACCHCTRWVALAAVLLPPVAYAGCVSNDYGWLSTAVPLLFRC